MQYPSYLACPLPVDDDVTKVADCGTLTSSAYAGTAYSSARIYYGYFDSSKYYQYSSSKFTANNTCTNTDRIGSGSSCISGNLLNWVTSSRGDIARKVLVGGRFNTAQSRYESEGSKYVYTDENLHCTFTITANVPTNRELTITNQTGFTTCPLNLSSKSNIMLDEPDIVNIQNLPGIIQEFWGRASFEFMIYASTKREGLMLSGKDATLSSLLNAMNNESPYGGTPAGEGLWEAYDYFKQVTSDSSAHPINYQDNNFATKMTDGGIDPWYDGTGLGGTPVWCRKGFVLMLSDGAWTGSVDPVLPARIMRVSDLRSDLESRQNVTTYPVYAFGDLDPAVSARGRQAMISTAIFGGFDFNNSSDFPYPFTSYPSTTDSRDVVYPLSECDPSGTMDSRCKQWDKDNDGLPDNFFEANSGEELIVALRRALNDMIRRATSGTAASVLASSEGSGANLFQAVFYPKRMFGNDEIDWIGEIHGLWYYIDPYLQNSTIREDTLKDRALNLNNDYVIQFEFDPLENKTKTTRYTDSNGDGAADSFVDTIYMEEMNTIWSAGIELFKRTGERTVYTSINGTNLLSGGFSSANSSTLAPYMDVDSATASKIISYIKGTDQAGYRSRTVTIGGTTAPWRLGDVVNSTPRIQSSIPINTYHLLPPNGYSDYTYSSYINTAGYKGRGIVYAGSNDGMLHAFKLGTLEQRWTGQGTLDKARLTGTELGSEVWSFIPRNALPYLKHLADSSYCHLYYVDLSPNLVDASIGGPADENKKADSWRTVLIGGMGLGGACRKTGDSCTNCVKTPILDPSDSSIGLGYSSYFALDVTDPNNPLLLWEFSSPQLGFSTSGPAIVRIGNPMKNGTWYAVFASGPTGPIDKIYHQFLGRSDQNLRLFVVDLRTGNLVRTIDTGLTNAFGGSLYNATIDTERGYAQSPGHYQDDVFYLGYVNGTNWTNGGVLRINTKEDADPAAWATSQVIQNIGPVTSSVVKLQDRKNGKLWLYFGTGRFYYKLYDTVDDAATQRALYGVKEPCYNVSTNNIDNTCTSSVSNLKNQTTTPTSTITATEGGWYVNLDTVSSYLQAERVITDPLAAFSGVVFFTTFAPSNDVCSLGGNTYIWALDYQSGYQPFALAGKALLQVSTGEIKQLDLSTVFSEKGGRRTVAISGVPPKGQGLSVLIGPRPLQKILHIQEK
jgi:type IV pilus assembly protein PilY1